MDRVSMARKITLYLVMIVLMAASTFFLSEVTLRLSGLVTTESIRTAPDQVFDRIPGVFDPGQVVIERPRAELTHRVSINSLGYRGQEMSLAKETGIIRILCLGDSFTYGSYVSDNETFPYYLQQRFSERRIPVEVINGGVGGTTIIDQLYFLKKGMPVSPDIVILTFSENDINDLSRWEPMYISLAKNRKLKSTFILRTVYQLVHGTALFNFALLVKATYFNQSRPRGIVDTSLSVQTNQNAGDELWRRYEKLLEEMQAYLETHSVDFVFAMFPSDHRIGDGSSTVASVVGRLDRIEKLAEKIGISTINFLEPLQKANRRREKLYLLPYDGHPSKAAYSIVANALFEYLDPIVERKLNRANRNH